MLWLVALAAAEESWELVRVSGGCEYRRGPLQEDGNRALYTVCTWPEVPGERVEELVSAYDEHDETWASIATCEEVDRSDEQVRVRHVHDLPGVADREIELTWTWTTEEDGATRHDWVRSAEQPEIDPARVNPIRDEGYYRIRDADEGCVVEALMLYDPGGSIPDWVVSATQVSSADLMMQELREKAGTGD